MSKQNEIKERILEKAKERFLQFGYSKTNMSEIAESLSMSKKTLYKFFPSKETLLRELIYGMKCKIDDAINKIWSNKELDFVDKLKILMNETGTHIAQLRGPLLTDLHKNIPEVWEEINHIRRKSAEPKFTALINEGVSKEIFRKDIYQRLIVLMYINAIEGIINPEILSQIPLTADQVYETIIKILFEGILTPEGRLKYCSFDNENINDK